MAVVHAQGAAFRLVRTRGELDIATLPELETSLVRALAPAGPPRLVLDMREVTFLDCFVVRVLLRARTAALSRGGWLVLVCGPVPVGTLLRRLDLAHRLPAHPTLPGAVARAERDGCREANGGHRAGC
ncbi:STAS domain-containing protein [Streptomyces albus subsp. chlorinus]|uniref:STAS domain-containing protein n=1 Tax=Streptomyces albus TaxID=1888 RepID=UPI0015713564|nr:STAS domain-containing protein [Streptomyces albus]NSC22559.1 STAS domain-containing protein [Streptomyces albus subsp. chlorinus]